MISSFLQILSEPRAISKKKIHQNLSHFSEKFRRQCCTERGNCERKNIDNATTWREGSATTEVVRLTKKPGNIFASVQKLASKKIF